MNSAPSAHERLRRLLFLVPFISHHQGLTVDEVAKHAGMSRAELLQELDLLTLVGRPPFQPDDFVDVYVEDDRVFVELDQRFSKPPRLTAAEGVALAAAATLLNPAPGSALSSALARLETALPAGASARYRQVKSQLDLATPANDGLLQLMKGVTDSRELEFDYLSGGQAAPERRRVQPHELFNHRGQWYLAAFCLTRTSDRLFRADRVSNLTLTDTTFEARPTQPRRLPDGSDSTEKVGVRFAATSRAAIVERFGEAARIRADGSVDVEVPGDSVAWLTSWVLSFGGDAVVQYPSWAVDAVGQAARASLQ